MEEAAGLLLVAYPDVPTKGKLDLSRTQMENTEGIFTEIHQSVSGVEHVQEGINEAVEHCTAKIEQLQRNMESHRNFDC